MHERVRRGDETRTGVVDSFIFRNDESGFAIARMSSVDGLQQWVAKGPLWGIEAGETVALSGAEQDDARWGRQFVVQTARPVLPVGPAAIRRYLASAKMTGIGPRMAERLVDHFGAETLDVIRQSPERLREVPGIGRRKQEELTAAMGRRQVQEEAQLFLYDLGVGTAMARRIWQRYGDDSVRKVRADPYRLARDVDGVGFRTADQMAAHLGFAPTAPERLQAGIVFALDQLARQGHTAPTEDEVHDVASRLLDCGQALLRAAANGLIDAGRIVREVVPGSHDVSGDGEPAQLAHLGLIGLVTAERRLAADLRRLAATVVDDVPAEAVAGRLELAEAALGFAVEGTQRSAIGAALRRALLVVTGGPGTGKTTIVQGVLAALGSDAPEVALAAPTGRAAHRLAEATGREAKTLHRLLEFDPRTMGFSRGADNPLDAALVIVDECSMLDTRLAAALCAAIRPGGRLLLVGDVDQLPSVGPGAVLDDLIRSRICAVARLDRIYRQAEASSIVVQAHAVRNGQVPEGSTTETGDFFVIVRHSPEEALATVLEIVLRRLPRRYGLDPAHDIQVLAPMHRGSLGTEALNEALRATLNPDGDQVGSGLRIGDKVIQGRNNYDLEVFNGDIGRIVGKVVEGAVPVRFGERTVSYPISSLDDLQTAYAITVHKAQGSEYPAVVVPLHDQHYAMLQRNLLYTAMTRGRRIVVIVGEPRAIARAVRNDAPLVRRTLLGHRLRGELPEPPTSTPEPA